MARDKRPGGPGRKPPRPRRPGDEERHDRARAAAGGFRSRPADGDGPQRRSFRDRQEGRSGQDRPARGEAREAGDRPARKWAPSTHGSDTASPRRGRSFRDGDRDEARPPVPRKARGRKLPPRAPRGRAPGSPRRCAACSPVPRRCAARAWRQGPPGSPVPRRCPARAWRQGPPGSPVPRRRAARAWRQGPPGSSGSRRRAARAW